MAWYWIVLYIIMAAFTAIIVNKFMQPLDKVICILMGLCWPLAIPAIPIFAAAILFVLPIAALAKLWNKWEK